MPRYKLTLEYDGNGYAGWQRQNDLMSVQEALQIACFKFSGEEVNIVGAGRTDAGVHATAQVAHIDLQKPLDAFRVMQGINFYLEIGHKNRIAIIDAEEVTEEFHARFSAKARHYRYRIINRRSRLGLEHGRAWHVVKPLDIEKMQQAAAMLVGHHDFTSFRDSQCQSKSPVKTLEKLDIAQHGEEIIIITSARSFLHHQVRIMTGTLALVGKGRWQPQDVQAALDAKDRAKAGVTAPPDGLYLVGVDY